MVAPKEFTMIRAYEPVTVITATGVQVGNVVSATATQVTVQINGQRYTFSRSKSYRTQLDRLVIDEVSR